MTKRRYLILVGLMLAVSHAHGVEIAREGCAVEWDYPNMHGVTFGFRAPHLDGSIPIKIGECGLEGDVRTCSISCAALNPPIGVQEWKVRAGIGSGDTVRHSAFATLLVDYRGDEPDDPAIIELPSPYNLRITVEMVRP